MKLHSISWLILRIHRYIQNSLIYIYIYTWSLVLVLWYLVGACPLGSSIGVVIWRCLSFCVLVVLPWCCLGAWRVLCGARPIVDTGICDTGIWTLFIHVHVQEVKVWTHLQSIQHPALSMKSVVIDRIWNFESTIQIVSLFRWYYVILLTCSRLSIRVSAGAWC